MRGLLVIGCLALVAAGCGGGGMPSAAVPSSMRWYITTGTRTEMGASSVRKSARDMVPDVPSGKRAVHVTS